MTDREVVLGVLGSAIINIRVLTGLRATEQSVEYANALANFVHNWPREIMRADVDTTWTAILAEAWRLCDQRLRPWFRAELEDRGVDLESLGR